MWLNVDVTLYCLLPSVYFEKSLLLLLSESYGEELVVRLIEVQRADGCDEQVDEIVSMKRRLRTVTVLGHLMYFPLILMIMMMIVLMSLKIVFVHRLLLTV